MGIIGEELYLPDCCMYCIVLVICNIPLLRKGLILASLVDVWR